ncbi:[4Fe-4S] proteins maturation [Gryganskiella cystojenkinii]|nr:[4Fe-4S] proteins maturation [Gryganskiella cystojenkinii]
MAPCFRCSSKLVRTASSLITPTAPLRPISAARPFSTIVRRAGIVVPSTINSTFLKTTVHSATGNNNSTFFSATTLSAFQHRWSSSSATATSTPSSTNHPIIEPVPGLKIHNPQYDEAGKELTVEITDKAVKQLKHIASRDNNPLQSLRITVDSGGCHGYQYLMDLTDEVNEDDVLFDKDGGRILVDTITLPMISGSRIDFIEELIGSAFKVLANPHAAHSCGCDTSFEIKI